ncbi:phosphoadenylyl-sulfate reductase [Prosthecomicrobium sp. N25]|uniref:phosphoadenylyl-sulfate reductase n=1 Tax=Prosthecomicrobium sp. N25 TaxID=3129254 RepID=UPI003077DE8F
MGRPERAADPIGAAPLRDVAVLEALYGALPTTALLDVAIHDLFPGRLALVSSFGAEAAVLLHLVAQVDRATPVVFVDTDRLFGETLRYRDRLTERLGLTDVRTLAPDAARVAEHDRDGALWLRDANLCCRIRKVEPLAAGLSGFDAWISGRKRFQAATRATIPVFEAEGTRIKVNPLAGWMPADLAAYAARHDLPPHPLVEQGYRSIGCMPCTTRVVEGEDDRAGRWRGQEKIECGIHLGLEADGSGI